MARIALLSIVLALLLALVPVGRAEPSSTVAVTGVVLDSASVPVPNAYVSAFPIDGSAGSIAWVPTDDHGSFRIFLVQGSYVIRAKHEAAGYPDPSLLFSADPEARFPKVSVDDRPVSGIRVVLGRKGGVLSGTVLDENTDSPISRASVILSDARNPSAFVELTTDDVGRFQFAVPHKQFVITAAASGYKRTTFENGKEQLLSENEQRNIIIKLLR